MKKYIEIYNFYKEKIQNGFLKNGDKIPSVRKSAEYLNVSITTVTNAYNALAADGFIIAKAQSGYYVSYKKNEGLPERQTVVKEEKIKYDFKSNKADASSFDINLWKRYIKNALKNDEKLLSYSETQGEYELRVALSEYIMKKRNIIAPPERIVVGAGTNNLLLILCSLIKNKKTVSIPESKSFKIGESIFKTFGFEITYRNKNAQIIYVSPSHMTRFGDVMSVKRRKELVEYSAKKNALVIEDDYESDFLYNKKPSPSVFTMAEKDNVVYIGSFSRLLLPGIRIGFMVLNEELSDLYNKHKDEFVQFASKTEQIALCSYIRDGHLYSQTRKIRRIYTAKTKELETCVKKEFKHSKIKISDNGLQLSLKTNCHKTLEEIKTLMKKYSFYATIDSFSNGNIYLILNSSGVNTNDFEDAVNTLKKILK